MFADDDLPSEVAEATRLLNLMKIGALTFTLTELDSLPEHLISNILLVARLQTEVRNARSEIAHKRGLALDDDTQQ